MKLDLKTMLKATLGGVLLTLGCTSASGLSPRESIISVNLS